MPTSRCPTSPSVPPVSRTKRPGDGFYTHINQKWLKKNHIDVWRSEYGVSDEIEEQTDQQLLDILGDLRKKSAPLRPTTSEEHLTLFSQIWYDRKTEAEELYLHTCLRQLIASNEPRDIGKYIGWICGARISTVIELVAQEETTPPYNVRVSLTPGALTMPLKYYLDPRLQGGPVCKAYIDYVTLCSIELGLPYLRHAIKAEAELAAILNKSFSDLTIRKTGHRLQTWVPEFEWQGFMEGLNIDDRWKERLWVIDSPDIIKNVIRWICTASTESVVSVFALHLITLSSPYIRPGIKAAADTIFHKALRGVGHTIPKEQEFLADVKVILPDALCNVYSEHQRDNGKINDVTNLVNHLRDSALEVMDETTVLAKKTAKLAQEKIRRMVFEIGKGTPADLPHVEYHPDSLVHTIISVLEGRTKLMMKSTGHPSQRIKSDYPCFVSNASYFSESNHIVMPWGILQWPFYCKAAPIGWNFGGVGATISHEMTHAFDLEGSQYSPRAVFKEWWTRKNRAQFQKRTRKVDTFFSRFKHYGIPLNGKRTLSENWADLGGIVISLRGLKTLLDSKNASEQERKEAHRNFFQAYAVSWRTLVRKEKMALSILTSVHAPGEDRVDRIVPQFQEWYDAFNITENDALYIPPNQRLKFF